MTGPDSAAQEPLDPMTEDLVELFDHVGGRLIDRMAGLTDQEWAWCPTADERVGLRWRIEHITKAMTEPRNRVWLGLPAQDEVPGVDPAGSAEEAIVGLRAALSSWRDTLTDPRSDLSEPIGRAAGRFGAATRYSFVLHLADELIHHGAEAALLRDLYAGTEHPTRADTSSG